MMCYEAIALADQNGRSYKSIFGTYSKKDGFKLDYKMRMLDNETLLYKIMHENCWRLVTEPKEKTISKRDAEKELSKLYKCSVSIHENSGDKIYTGEDNNKYNKENENFSVFPEDISSVLRLLDETITRR